MPITSLLQEIQSNRYAWRVVRNYRLTTFRTATDEERPCRASSVSFENDKLRRAASLNPRNILAEHRHLVWCLASKSKILAPHAA